MKLSNVLQLYTDCGNTIKEDPYRDGYAHYTTMFSCQAIAKRSILGRINGELQFVHTEPITPSCSKIEGETTHNYNGNGCFIDGDCLFGPDHRWTWGSCWAINPIGELPIRPDVVYKLKPPMKPVSFSKEELESMTLCRSYGD